MKIAPKELITTTDVAQEYMRLVNRLAMLIPSVELQQHDFDVEKAKTATYAMVASVHEELLRQANGVFDYYLNNPTELARLKRDTIALNPENKGSSH